VTEDHQFIHVDPERAKATPFGGTVAHGFLTVSGNRSCRARGRVA
jgi:acyl dehydratase